MDFIEVKIVNWESYNPRRDYKRPWWFALSNKITSDDMFSEFSDAEFKAWIHILCTASVQNSEVAKVFFKHAERSAGIKRKTLSDVIHKLEILEVIQVQAAICTESVRDLYATVHNSTVHNKTNNIAQSGDFAAFWAEVPRKVGKEKASKSYLREIRSGVSHDSIMAHLRKFTQYHRENRTEAKFIPHASTFINNHKEWADPSHGQSEDFSITPKPDLSDIFRKDASGD